jgi:hypothetical protein
MEQQTTQGSPDHGTTKGEPIPVNIKREETKKEEA